MPDCGGDITGAAFDEAVCCGRPGASFVSPDCDIADIRVVLKELDGRITVGKAGANACVARDACSNALANSFTVGKRCCGSFAKARKTTISTSSEMLGMFP